MSYKKMGITVLSLVLCFLIIICVLTVVFDPYFHYHAPFEGQGYMLHNERYQNDGITRHFTYDAIITGTSMTENFKTTECDAIFGTQSIKIPFYGASFKEINDATAKAIERNSDVKMVIRCLDTYRFLEDKDAMNYSDYPEYLYDENLFNDVNYLFNKDILLGDVYPVAMSTLRGVSPTTFDDYANWDTTATYGREVVLSDYNRGDVAENINLLADDEKDVVRGTVEQNIITAARENPDVDFYLFLPPYSIVYWDSLYVKGDLSKHLEAQQMAIEMMLDYENIHLYSFLTDYKTVCDLNNYKDTVHYRGEINAKILECMKTGEYKVDKDNSSEYFSEVYEFYTGFDYNGLFE